MRHVLIINANPDSSHERLGSALAHAYQRGAQSTDCTVQRIDIGGIHIPLLRNAQEFATKAFTRSILRMAGFFPVRVSYFGGAAITAPHSARLVEKVRDMGRHLA